ncbi:hypothetical protein BC834DRAFT_819265 [Gloeopeniophorella convolvens]|nr:hypothetical protein BC834DRAFT_819265 [Gloeopeniophorella convolvens]
MGDTQQILSNQSTQQRSFHALDIPQAAIDPLAGAELRHRYQTWLNPPDSSTNQNFASDRHHIGTSSWFLEGRVFEEWRKTGSVMWIHGKPGSGKSILCSTIIKELERLHAGERSSTVAYFYFDFRDSKKQAFHGMLASLIVQLSVVSDTLCDVISHMYSAHGDGLRQPGEGALAQCLLDMLSASGQGTRYVILDALDECPHNRVSPPRHKILNFLVQMSSQCPSDLRVCIMSRPEDDIADTLRPLALHRVCLEDESDHALDMEHYIRHEVNTNVRMRKWPEKTRNLVIETLSKNANGMYVVVLARVSER